MRQSSAPRRGDHPTVSERRYTSGSEYFPGLIDEVPIYHIALSEAQVQQHFNAGAR